METIQLALIWWRSKSQFVKEELAQLYYQCEATNLTQDNIKELYSSNMLSL